jgi:hypothetical protein
MGKKATKSGNIHLPPGAEPPPDENAKIPFQVSHAAAVANALATGQPVLPKPKPKARPGFPHSEADIDNALQCLRQGQLQLTDPEFRVICDLAEAGAKHLKAVRRGAQEPRGISHSVTKRAEAVLQAYRELPSRLQARPNGATTLGALRRAVIKKLGLADDDGVLSEETIRKDIQEMRPIFQLVREGKMPAPGAKSVNRMLSKQTQREMLAGRRTRAKHRP